MNKKHYLIYQITNTVNNKIYIGKHITENIDDEYFGSGKHLKHAQKKYGLDKFVKTILFELQSKEEMDLLEKLVVTEEFCARSDTYNIKVGGEGGWDYVNKNPSLMGYNFTNYKLAKEKGIYKQAYQRWIKSLTPEEYKHFRQIWSKAGSKARRLQNTRRIGTHLSLQTKQKIGIKTRQRLAKHPEQNPMFGMTWIINEECELCIMVNKQLAKNIIADNNKWKYGKINDFSAYRYQQHQKTLKTFEYLEHQKKQKELNIVFYTFYYKKYLQYGYKIFQQIYQLDIERTALLHLFKRYALNYGSYKRWHKVK